MLITKRVNVKITPSNYQHFKNLGYDIPMKKASKEHQRKTGEEYVFINGSVIEVDVNDLSTRSTALVEVQCDHCKKNKEMKYCNYKVRIENNGNYYCKDCWKFRQEESMQKIYGVKSCMELQEVRNKLSNTKKNQSKERKAEILQKKIETSRLHYGTDYPSQSEEVKEAIRNTTNAKYGVDNGMKSDIVKERARNTMIEKYGAPYSSQVPEIKKKIAETAYKNQTVRTSNQQRYLSNLFDGALNDVISRFNVDMVLDNNIVCEYDGKGHDLRVTLNYCTQEEFDEHEIVRDKLIKKEGYKIFRIISHTDKLPSDEVLLQMLELTKQYFADYPEHSWREWYLDEGIYKDAEHKDGAPFDYGKLNKIKTVA